MGCFHDETILTYNKTNLGYNEIYLIFKSTEKPCVKRFLTKRKGTQA